MHWAAALAGAAVALRGETIIEMLPNERIEYIQEEEAPLCEMDEQKIAFSWSNGRAMTMEQAVEFSLVDPE